MPDQRAAISHRELILGIGGQHPASEACRAFPLRGGQAAAGAAKLSQSCFRIVLDGLRGEHIIAELCRREGIAESLYYTWSKEFLEAGKRRLAGDTALEVNRRSERGVEAFYNLAITPWLRLSADLQVIDPWNPTKSRATYGALRLQIKF
jgi:Carbohydrate-selective porin, OprB family